MKNTLNTEDRQFILASLNETFHNANNKLEADKANPTLGILERKNLKDTMKKARELINQLM